MRGFVHISYLFMHHNPVYLAYLISVYIIMSSQWLHLFTTTTRYSNADRNGSIFIKLFVYLLSGMCMHCFTLQKARQQLSPASQSSSLLHSKASLTLWQISGRGNLTAGQLKKITIFFYKCVILFDFIAYILFGYIVKLYCFRLFFNYQVACYILGQHEHSTVGYQIISA